MHIMKWRHLREQEDKGIFRKEGESSAAECLPRLVPRCEVGTDIPHIPFTIPQIFFSVIMITFCSVSQFFNSQYIKKYFFLI